LTTFVLIFKILSKVNNPPNGRKFAQSGHPECGRKTNEFVSLIKLAKIPNFFSTFFHDNPMYSLGQTEGTGQSSGELIRTGINFRDFCKNFRREKCHLKKRWDNFLPM
jgi:hypothetical protein